MAPGSPCVRGPKPKEPPPIRYAIQSWLSRLPTGGEYQCSVDELMNEAPKRFIAYAPMVLLPSGSFRGPLWTRVIQTASATEKSLLWAGILREVTRRERGTMTHLAVNDGIPSHLLALGQGSVGEVPENVLRSPTGLVTLYGDFGPACAPETVDDEACRTAFWVSTKQNGITQAWAPRWTMFSRGNIKEKGRLLSFHDISKSPSPSPHPRRTLGKARLAECWAVDLYAGIGYFAFSYVRLGMRALCWELNPWSVEGLRRGAKANGWSVRLVEGKELATVHLRDVISTGEQIIVFLEDNALAGERIRSLDEHVQARVTHVNCGFLPTSRPTWRMAWDHITDGTSLAWLHLHENVGVTDIGKRKDEIQALLDGFKGGREPDRQAVVEHVEVVKSFAPGVWHCVFDVVITKAL